METKALGSVSKPVSCHKDVWTMFWSTNSECNRGWNEYWHYDIIILL